MKNVSVIIMILISLGCQKDDFSQADLIGTWMDDRGIQWTFYPDGELETRPEIANAAIILYKYDFLTPHTMRRHLYGHKEWIGYQQTTAIWRSEISERIIITELSSHQVHFEIHKVTVNKEDPPWTTILIKR